MADKKASYTPMPQVPAELRDRYEAVLQVLTGKATVSAAARTLGLSRNHFQTVMHRGLEGMIEGLRPKAAGRPPIPEREAELLRDNEQLRQENARLSERTETTDRLLQVASGLLKGRAQSSPRASRTKAATKTTKAEEPDDTLIEGARQMRAAGLTATLTAAVLGTSTSTLRRWTARSRAGVALQRRRGPEARDVSVDRQVAAQVEDLVRSTNGLMGAASLAHGVAGVSRRQAAGIKAKVLTAMERERRARCDSVIVTAPGVLRGFDQLWVNTTDGMRPVLVSCEGYVPYRTNLAVAPRYDSASVARAVDDDFRRNGAPLVWRADRAACQRTDEVDEVLRGWGVLRLHGPAHLARYYGQLERQNREHRAWLERLPEPSPEELVAACQDMRLALNERWVRRSLGWMTAAEKLATLAAPCDDRAQLRASVAERAARLRREDHLHDTRDALLVERLAIEHELTKRGYLQRIPGGWC
jgi:transposase-like protein